MGDEEHALGAEADGVEGREPGFSEAGGDDDEAVGAVLLKGFESFALDVVGLGDFRSRARRGLGAFGRRVR